MEAHVLRILNDTLVLLKRGVRLEQNNDIRQEMQRMVVKYQWVLSILNNRRNV